MSPAPDMSNETMVIDPAATTTITNLLSSSDELDHTQFIEPQIDLGALTIESMEDVNLSDDDEGSVALNKEPVVPFTTCSAPSTPTGERDPPLGFRRSSVSAPTNDEQDLARVEITYQNGQNGSDDGNGLIDTFFGCLKPFFSVVNKIGENIKYTKDTSPSSKPVDDWLIPIDSIVNDLVLIGTGIEGSVYLGKLGAQNIACKRVKTEEETNIKHLRKLNHINVIKFRGISISSPLFYIVMEYCAYGSVFDVLKRRREKQSCTKPTQVLDWSQQISNGLNYLHANKIVHRDVKSPNILIADNYILKISDFGTSKQLGSKQGQVMSFNGTSAWMAPEVIRQEPSSEKIDVWSFGVVLWEILTCQVPYQNIDPNAIMWGVGTGRLNLPIPSSVPNGFRLLMNMCWSPKPVNRPSFQQIIKHLSISEPEIILFEQEQEYTELTRVWSTEITEQLARLPTIDISATLQMSNDELMKKRKEELQHIADIRSHYQTKLQQVNTLYIELSSLMMQLQKREQEIKKKERLLNIHQHSSTGNSSGKKRSTNPILEARKKSLQLIKAASFNLNDPSMIFSQTSAKKSSSTKSNHTVSTNQPSNTSTSPPANNNPDLSNNKIVQRRKKGPGHRRTNSKGSVASWTPPSLSAIADQEQKRASIHIPSSTTEEHSTNNDVNHSPLPTISANIDFKPTVIHRQLNPKTLRLDLQSSVDSQTTPTASNIRPSTIFTYALRKSSSSDPEEHDDNQHPNFSRPRRRRTFISANNRISSPSSATIRSVKSNLNTPQLDESETTIHPMDEKTDADKMNDLRRHPKNIGFHAVTTDQTPPYPQRQTSKRQMRYSSSEEGEVEEIPSDHYVFDDEKHRAMHQDLNGETNGIFSSESEIYHENTRRSSLSKNEGLFSDEGGHVSDYRPASRESLLNSEAEHEWHE